MKCNTLIKETRREIYYLYLLKGKGSLGSQWLIYDSVLPKWFIIYYDLLEWIYNLDVLVWVSSSLIYDRRSLIPLPLYPSTPVVYVSKSIQFYFFKTSILYILPLVSIVMTKNMNFKRFPLSRIYKNDLCVFSINALHDLIQLIVLTR